jgi:hypothetical protein
MCNDWNENRTEGRNPQELKDIVDLNKLNGVKEGIEQCLIRDVNLKQFERLFCLVKTGV